MLHKQSINTVEELTYAYTMPEARAKFKTTAEDFIVQEILSFEPSGEGTHAFLYIEKTNINTQLLARQLARFANVSVKEIGYAGLKDRNSISRQWFSVNMEVTDEPDWDHFEQEGARLLAKTYHNKKLKRGSIQKNFFEVVLRDINPQDVINIKRRLNIIQQNGVPNYFAQQRFGHKYSNLHQAIGWFNGQKKLKRREEKSLVLSAARSMIFNIALADRISAVGWGVLLDGEVMIINNSRSIFKLHGIDETIRTRFKKGEIHPTAPLWGKGQLQSQKQVQTLEEQLQNDWMFWCQALEEKGLRQERRAIRLIPHDLRFDFRGSNLYLSFSLPAGAYATAVLREVVQI